METIKTMRKYEIYKNYEKILELYRIWKNMTKYKDLKKYEKHEKY